jgi:sulfide:quinone oxidoreductase
VPRDAWKSRVDYDYLVICHRAAPGLRRSAGSGPSAAYAIDLHHRTCPDAWAAYEEFLKDPGPIVIGAVQGASCFGPAYEFAMILDADLRKRKLRDKRADDLSSPASPTWATWGSGGVGDSKGLMESELRQRHIKWITNSEGHRSARRARCRRRG